jgi:hypothetical protein
LKEIIMKTVRKLVAGIGFAATMVATTPASAFTQIFLVDRAGTTLFSSYIGSPNSAGIVFGGNLNGWNLSASTTGVTDDPLNFKMDIQTSAFFSGATTNTLSALNIAGQISQYAGTGMSASVLDKSVLRVRVISDAYPLTIGSTVNLTDSFGLSNTPIGTRFGGGSVNGLSAIEVDTNSAGTLSPGGGPSSFQSAPTAYVTPVGQNFTYQFVQNNFGNVMQAGYDLILPTTTGIAAGPGNTNPDVNLCALDTVANNGTYECLSTQVSVNRFAVTSSIQAYNAVPEPGTLALLGMSLLGMGAIRRRQAA